MISFDDKQFHFHGNDQINQELMTEFAHTTCNNLNGKHIFLKSTNLTHSQTIVRWYSLHACHCDDKHIQTQQIKRNLEIESFYFRETKYFLKPHFLLYNL